MVKLVATLSSYGRRAVVAGGVADRYASELARAGQSNRRRAGTGSAAPERATRPPLWPAGMAEGNRATFGPRVGLSSHGSPAKGGPKSKCLARLKIARTSAGPSSLTISDLSRFPVPEQDGTRAASQIKAFHDTWHWDESAERSYDEFITSAPYDASKALEAFRTLLGRNDLSAYLSMMATRVVELHRVLERAAKQDPES